THRTIENLAAAALRSKEPGKQSPILVRMRDGTGEPPIFVVYAGGHQYRLAQFVGWDQPVFGIDVPLSTAWCEAAASNRSADLPTLEQMVEPYVEALWAYCGPSPCILTGHCFGALMAFELAHQFQQRGGVVEKVILFDGAAAIPEPFQAAW